MSFSFTCEKRTSVLTLKKKGIHDKDHDIKISDEATDYRPPPHDGLLHGDVFPIGIDKAILKEYENIFEPPESFRLIPVLPTYNDVTSPCMFLRPNIVKGPYENVEHYLDVQYRLLREDYVMCFRDGIAEYVNLKKQKESFKYCQNVKVHTNVKIGKETIIDGDLIYTLNFNSNRFAEILWNRNRRLLTGSLLCLSSDDFKTVHFVIIKRREIENLKKGLLEVKFEGNHEDSYNVSRLSKFVVLESSAYYEAYRHNLTALLKLNPETIPFKRYIIEVQKNVFHPSYLYEATKYDMSPLFDSVQQNKNSRSFCNTVCSIGTFLHPSDVEKAPMNATSIFNAMAQKIDSYNAKSINILNTASWPSAADLCFDNSQLNAIKIALTKELAIIQGPPGTGKTFVGLKIVELLLKNKRSWYNENKNLLPVLVVCFTNHALDQFLEGLLAFTNEIARVGGRSSSEKIQHYMLHKLKKNPRRPRYNVKLKKIQLIQIKNALIKTQEQIEKSYESILETEDLQEHMMPEHLETLQKGFQKERCQYILTVCDWLGKRNVSMYEVRSNLSAVDAMIELDVMSVTHVWKLNAQERWKLYKFWLYEYIKTKYKECTDLNEKINAKIEEIENSQAQEDLNALKYNRVSVVGMTTNGAAKYRGLVQALNPAILIVEEAAEVLESHIITSLAPNTQHLIMIGDQQQLRPNTTMHILAVKYKMNISLFERMILNEIEYCRLNVQHRMRPEIASLIVPHIYPHLENDESVTKFEDILGVKKNVFFISHEIQESSEKYSKTRANRHEAKFLIGLCKYLILQGHKPSSITILTTYTGQLFLLKELAKDLSYNYSPFQEVNITVVDNFQGEENDIILVSFVRSNNAGIIGFLKEPNRVCVALSRARKGLFCIGNFDLFEQKSMLWKNIKRILVSSQSIGSYLPLICQNHPDTCTEIATSEDFKKVPDGGCSRKCEVPRSCGHECSLMCHPFDHEDINCEKPCQKVCERNHPCEKICYQECYCTVEIERTLVKCGHKVKVFCGMPENEIKCQYPCERKCLNDHLCEKKCYENCYCVVKINRTLTACGHVVEEKCGKPENQIKCSSTCSKILPCTHLCTKKCGEKCTSWCEEQCLKSCPEGHPCPLKCSEACKKCEIHVDKTCPQNHEYQVICHKSKWSFCPTLVEKKLRKCGHTVSIACGMKETNFTCMQACTKTLKCSHKCVKKCWAYCETPCLQPCLKTCVQGHNCLKQCYKICGPCDVLVDRTLSICGHTVKAPCGMSDESILCSLPCEKKLMCGHSCTNRCGEPCTLKCVYLKEINSLICGHTIQANCFLFQDPDLLKERFFDLLDKCTELCTDILPCGHKCTGTCGSCHQQRLHVPCKAPCNRTLVCGHKCLSTCSSSCPPCKQPCENKCRHHTCKRDCYLPCVKCKKPCRWSCPHQKCTKSCYEICNRPPCNEPCLKVLPCSHPCIGFCGEPCPPLCRICCHPSEKDILDDYDGNARYIVLEDCGHIFEVLGLNQWMKMSDENKETKLMMKTCPQCGTVIKKSLRYGSIIKHILLQMEKIKMQVQWNPQRLKNIQSNLLVKSESLPSTKYFKAKNITNSLSLNFVRDIQELTNIENFLSISEKFSEINMNYQANDPNKTIIKPFVEYFKLNSQWLSSTLEKFLTASEHQQIQLSYEVHRLTLIENLMHQAKNVQDSHKNEFDNCVKYLLNYRPFNDKVNDSFTSSLRILLCKLDEESDVKCSLTNLPYLKAMNMSIGHWYICLKGHVYCIINYVGTNRKGCYECLRENNSTDDSKFGLVKFPKTSQLPSFIHEEQFGSKYFSQKSRNYRDQDSDNSFQPHYFKNIRKFSATRSVSGHRDRHRYTLLKQNEGKGKICGTFGSFNYLDQLHCSENSFQDSACSSASRERKMHHYSSSGQNEGKAMIQNKPQRHYHEDADESHQLHYSKISLGEASAHISAVKTKKSHYYSSYRRNENRATIQRKPHHEDADVPCSLRHSNKSFWEPPVFSSPSGERERRYFTPSHQYEKTAMHYKKHFSGSVDFSPKLYHSEKQFEEASVSSPAVNHKRHNSEKQFEEYSVPSPVAKQTKRNHSEKQFEEYSVSSPVAKQTKRNHSEKQFEEYSVSSPPAKQTKRHHSEKHFEESSVFSPALQRSKRYHYAHSSQNDGSSTVYKKYCKDSGLTQQFRSKKSVWEHPAHSSAVLQRQDRASVFYSMAIKHLKF